MEEMETDIPEVKLPEGSDVRWIFEVIDALREMAKTLGNTFTGPIVAKTIHDLNHYADVLEEEDHA